MEEIKTAELMGFIYDILNFEDGVDAEGRRVRRRVFPKAHLKTARGLSSAMEHYLVVVLRKPDGEFERISLDEVKANKNLIEGKQVYAEEFVVGVPLGLSEADVKTIKHFYDERQELPLIGSEGFADFESIIGG